MTPAQTEILAKSIERTSSDASRLGEVRGRLLMDAMARLSEAGVKAIHATELGARCVEMAEEDLLAFVENKAGRSVTFSAAATADILQAMGSQHVAGAVDAALQQRAHIAARKKEAASGITRSMVLDVRSNKAEF
jgi:hypothetical protein